MKPANGSPWREARALLGWLDPAEAKRALSLGLGETRQEAEIAALVAEARAAAAARPPLVDVEGAVSDAPAVLDEHVERLEADPILRAGLADGWQVKMLDLTKVSPVQGYVFADHPVSEKVATAPTDPLGLAAITLPVTGDVEVPGHYSPEARSWVFSSQDFNLRLMREHRTRVAPGVFSFGFLVAVTPSVVRVAAYANRLVLLDGNHRVFGLLRRGVTRAPALVKRHTTWPQMPPAVALLPESALLGPHPPLVSDFLRPEHYTVVSMPQTRRIVMIQAIDVSVAG